LGTRREIAIPEDYLQIDMGDAWLMPGMIDLHCHVAGESIFQTNDLNDMIYMTNAGLRASASVVPGIQTMRTALAGGITTVLYIPGSGTNMGGQGVLMKTWPERYESAELRNPGSLKLAQAGNPERWAIGVGRSLMNWTIRNTFLRGLAHAREARAGRDRDRVGRIDPDWEIFLHLLTRNAQVSTHTQMYQVVLTTITMVRIELGLDVFIDHGTIGGWRAGGLAAKHGVPAIVGPRAVDPPSRGFAIITGQIEPGFRGVAAGYQELGHEEVGFNTDSPIVPQEELPVQAAMGARHGFRDDAMQTVRGLTIVPARAAGIADRVGSLEVGKHADILAITGHPADPRSYVKRVWVEGTLAYEGQPGERLW
jgi:imidazolonepropionase-like amidohydrolase